MFNGTGGRPERVLLFVVDEAEEANRLKIDFDCLAQAQSRQQSSTHAQPQQRNNKVRTSTSAALAVCDVLTFFVVVPPGSPGALRRSRSPDQPEGRAHAGRELRRGLC